MLRLRLAARRWLKRLLFAAVASGIVGGALYAAAWMVPLPERLAATPSTVVEYRDGTVAHVFLSSDEKWRVPVRLEEVEPAYVEALLRLEDKRFWSHPGVDPIAVARAVGLNVARGRRVSGASTVTMQLVRVLEPRPRTWSSKAIEALRALQLEARMSKQEILEAYLQFVPYGGNVEGIESASLAYFGHRATALSPPEIATLLAVPQNPGRRAPSPGNEARLRAARDEIAARLLAEDALPLGSESARRTPAEVLEEVRASEVVTKPRPVPREAAHAAYWLRAAHPSELRIRTTLDRGVQQLAQRALSGTTEESRARGIHNASVVVVHHATGEVRALVGGFDFFASESGAQIAAFDVPRSPGSTLKPFLFALAVEQGLAGPEHLVPDVPVVYGAYAPKNYDGNFDGVVKLEDALSRSLNVPFVELLGRMGVDDFLGALRGMGARSLSDEPGHYGLSAIVGGLELSPLEVASLYTTLARDGEHVPLRWRPGNGEPPAGQRVFAEGSAFLTQRALSLKDRPDFPARRRYTAMPRGIHWKTGTSFGNRDAWAAGSDSTHTAVVWMGNLDNTSSSELIGADAAGPVLFDVLEAAADTSRLPPPSHPPRELIEVEVCAYSGHPAHAACGATKHVLARRTAVPTKPCPYHVSVEVDVDSGRAVNPTCRAGRKVEARTYLVWPSNVRRWLKDQERSLPTPPALAEGCEAAMAARPPEIVSPPAGQTALLVPGVPPEQQEIPLEAETVGHARLSWFVNGEFVGTASADERVWWTPRVGAHEIVVSDQAGRSARRVIEVRSRMF